jgi:hypothetical protein
MFCLVTHVSMHYVMMLRYKYIIIFKRSFFCEYSYTLCPKIQGTLFLHSLVNNFDHYYIQNYMVLECKNDTVSFILQISFISYIFMQILWTYYKYKSVDQWNLRAAYILGWKGVQDNMYRSYCCLFIMICMLSYNQLFE